MKSRVIIIVVAILIILLTVRTCTKEDYVAPYEKELVQQYKYEIVHDTITIVITKTDTVIVKIEEIIISAITVAETTVREAVMERDAMVLKMVEFDAVKNVTVYDTVKITLLPDSIMLPDSVMLFNVFEYHSTIGGEVIAIRDTIQSRKVSRYYAQKYILSK